ncbi:sec-independent protein translocase protein TATA, chloroplastic-like [Quercus robur]|uniref:sec-independent protein translocase protein TATA, chloroplastic-like n=1 Tax=Quercus robur TaxID=38942 RepID=UPI0021639C34|nr:sec-independent protein translocase protein TATA, chloroplastic-like [Quercus robur]
MISERVVRNKEVDSKGVDSAPGNDYLINEYIVVLCGATTRTRVERARKGLTCNAWFGLGVPELVVIAGDAALVFGPKKLPEVGKSIGKTVKSFQQDAPLIEQSPTLPKSSTKKVISFILEFLDFFVYRELRKNNRIFCKC